MSEQGQQALVDKLYDRIAEADRAIAKLAPDSKRITWLQEKQAILSTINAGRTGAQFVVGHNERLTPGYTLREAIDSAMAVNP